MNSSRARLPKGLRIYAIGDVHGCLKELKALISLIDADTRERPVRNREIVFLGDYVDRGPKNKGVIDYLIELEAGKRKTVFLRGNHDERLARFLSEPEKVGAGFLRWGGDTTMRDYGIIMKDGESYSAVSKRFQRKFPKSHKAFLRRLKYSHEVGDYFFVHAGIRPGVPLAKQKPSDLMWIRDEFLPSKRQHPKVIVHGHTPVSNPAVHSNRIEVDTRCYDTGRLTAVVLEGSEKRFIQTPC